MELFEAMQKSFSRFSEEEAKALFDAYISISDILSDASVNQMPGKLACDTGFKLGFIAGLEYQKYASLPKKEKE